MVSKKTLKDYDFRTIENYFDYILESKMNGQQQQVESLLRELTKKQKKQFINYIGAFDLRDTEEAKYCKQKALYLL